MTSIRRKPTMLGARRNTAEQEREQFQKSQETSFRKAINDEEVPVKMKHIRNLIIGSHTVKNGSLFWSLVMLSPPLHTDITAWKFCHALHLILRDGHIKVIRDSIEHIVRLRDMGEHFRHLPMSYGTLIQKYCSLLICKLNFHQHYPKFPGYLQVSPEELQAIAENDANNFFEMAVEMLEYMENVLGLYEAVFQSLDPSRANSMTKMGQCRLAPLIPCIQDSSCLYDFIVRILFQLHKVVPTDMLTGHRTRFNSQFKLMHQFYTNTRNLQYFKSLIQVPHLPKVPPNFLVEAELGCHVAPVVVMEEEQLDPSDIVSDSVLIDTSELEPPPVPPHPHPDVINSHNGSLVDASMVAERDSLIENLNEELKIARNTIQTIHSKSTYVQEQLNHKINDLESTIAELDSELIAEHQSKESILIQVEAAAASAEAVIKLDDEEIKRRSAEEKYNKLKEVYMKLRDEHILLIRMKAELEKSFLIEKENYQKEIVLKMQIAAELLMMESKIIDLSKVEKLLEQSNNKNIFLEKELHSVQADKERTLMANLDSDTALTDLKLNIQGLELEKAELEKSFHLEKENCQKEILLKKEIATDLVMMESKVIDLSQVKKLLEQSNDKNLFLEKELHNVHEEDKERTLLAKVDHDTALTELKFNMQHQIQRLEQETCENLTERELSMDECLAVAINSNIMHIEFFQSHFDNEAYSQVKSTPEYTLSYRELIDDSFGNLSVSFTSYLNDRKQTKFVIFDCNVFGFFISSFLLYAKATSHVSPDLETAEDLIIALEELSKCATELLEGMKNKTETEGISNLFRIKLGRCLELVSQCEDISPSDEDLSTVIEREMEFMNKSIYEAVEKFTKLLQDSRARDTGMQLEVNEGILGTCGDLMDAVRLLVQRASQLQVEIVGAGKGGSSPTEFYKRNHRWTEGLISGAKAVAIACQALVTSADEVATGKGKFEKVIVASREIAASSMQLVMASRVKAGKESVKLSDLNKTAKVISNLTGTVVATAESYRDKINEAVLDFSNLSLHETKRREMDTLVSVLEIEKKLENERMKLSSLRKYHYQLAGELSAEKMRTCHND